MAELMPKSLVSKIQNGESITVEFKRSYDQLPNNLFETVCAMLNRSGGHIFLGINDDGSIDKGIATTAIAKLKKDFVNMCNNPQKIFPTIHIELNDYTINNKIILYAFIYESSDVHKTANKIFDRNEDGDFDITCNTHLLSQMYIRKSSTYIENKIYPYAKTSDLRIDLIEKARRLASNRTANHPWEQMNNDELLRSAGLYERDLQSGEEGINLAGILLLGKDETIASALSYYRTDAILRINDIERYDDRDDIRTNLLDSYDRLISFLQKHTDEKFYIENGQRINIRDIIAREICANMLIHREYSNPTPAQLLIEQNTITTINANKPRFVGYIDTSNFSPFPKNPRIASFFKEVGYADELGSGIKKIAKYAKIYSNNNPSFQEGETFQAIVYLSNSSKPTQHTDLRKRILTFIIENNGVSRKDINNFIYPSLQEYTETQKSSKIHNIMANLSRNGLIKNEGSNKAPSWIYCAKKEHNKKHNNPNKTTIHTVSKQSLLKNQLLCYNKTNNTCFYAYA